MVGDGVGDGGEVNMFVGMALERVPSMIVCGLLDWYGLVWFGLRLEWFGLVWVGTSMHVWNFLVRYQDIGK